MIGIYKITSPSGKVYIGQSTDIEKRFISYKSLKCKTQTKLFRSLKKYGYKNHIFEVIEECSIELLNELERYWQDFYNVISENGLNLKLTNTNDKSGRLSEETKTKIGKSNKISNKGNSVPQSHIIKLQKINKGKKRSDEFKRKLSENRKCEKNPMYGKKTSEKTKKLLKEKLSGDKNYLSKIILNTETGIYYFGLNEASFSINIPKARLWTYLKGVCENKTNLIYV